MSATWHEGRMACLDFESTGTDPNEARIVEAYLGLVGGGQPSIDREPMLIDPGVEIPAEAAKIHGFTTEHVREHGIPAAEGVGRIAAAVKAAWDEGIPLVGHNIGGYDLTLLDREMVRHGFGPLIDLCGGSYGPVIDTFVISKMLDRWRRKASAEQGAHALKTCAQVFRVGWNDDDAHGARYDALTAARVAWRMGSIAAMPRAQRPRIQAGRGDDRHLFDQLAVPLPVLFQHQQRWAAEQAASYQEWLHSPKAGGKHNPDAVIDGSWPVQTAPTTSATAREAMPA